MSRSSARASAAAIAIACLGVAGLAILPAAVSSPAAAPTSVVDTATTESTVPTTTGVPAFADGEEARAAAEDLIASYIASEYGETVTNEACSVPPTGAVGEEFACYALKSGDLVIALRATVAEDRLIELELILDQTEATTTTSATTIAETETTG